MEKDDRYKNLEEENDLMREMMEDYEEEIRDLKNKLDRVEEENRKKIDKMKQQLKEKDKLIRKLENYIIRQHGDEEEELSFDDEGPRGNDGRRCLSPIPEEDPDEIEGYYDAW